MRIISDKRQNPTTFSKRTNNPISSINLVENFLTPYFVTLSLIPKAQIQGKQRGARWNVTDGALTHEKRKRRRGHQYETKQILLVFNVYCVFFFFLVMWFVLQSYEWKEIWIKSPDSNCLCMWTSNMTRMIQGLEWLLHRALFNREGLLKLEEMTEMGCGRDRWDPGHSE